MQRVILGNLSLLGISYQGPERDREYRNRFSQPGEMVRVMRVALRYGVRTFAASSHDFNELSPLYLNAVKGLETEGADVSLIACMGIPITFRGGPINVYRRWKTHLVYESKAFESVRERYFADPILNCRPGWTGNLTVARPYERRELERELKVDWKRWEESVAKISDHQIAWIEPGSEADFLAISRLDLLEELLDVTHELGYRALLGSHHLGASAPLLRERRVKRFDGYVTPVNKDGVMMFPTQREVEGVLRGLRDDRKVAVGIKPFAGGRLKPRDALNYVYNEMQVDSCMMGVGSEAEAEEDFSVALEILRQVRT
jgi:hypothetical protein